MIELINTKWHKLLQSEFNQNYFKKLQSFVNLERENNEVIYPPKEKVLSAFNYCKVENLKVVILGQDPYHGHNQANGLAFAVSKGVKAPPSLRNILQEVQSDLGVNIDDINNHVDLSNWAKQGVLLLNTVLTVKANQPLSHKNKGWEIFTDAVIRTVSEHKKRVIFVLWGGHAQKKEILIDLNKHLVLKSAHPSPLSAYRGFFGCKHFSMINNELSRRKEKPIKWL